MKEILRIMPRHDELPMSISLAGISYCDGSYHIHRDVSDETVIEYVLQGSGYIRVDDKTSFVTADQIYILPKGTMHDYYSTAEDPWQKVFLNLEGNLPLMLLHEYGLADQIVFNGVGLKHLFKRIMHLVSDSQSDDEIQAAFCAVYLEIITTLHMRNPHINRNEEAIRLKTHLDSHLDRIVSNRELAELIFRSVDYCIKLFRREYGITPYEYQLREKTRIACHLLSNTTLAVYEIAQMVGYNDPQYFSGFFKQRCGMSPRAFRNRSSHGERKEVESVD